MIRGRNRNHDYRDNIHHRRPGNRIGERDDDYYRRQQFCPGLDHGGLGLCGGNRNHDYRDGIHHCSGNRNGERDDDHYRRQQFCLGLDHRGSGPRGRHNSNSQEICIVFTASKSSRLL